MPKRTAVTEVFSRDEIDMLTRRSDWQGAKAVLSSWLIIAFAFAIVAWGWPLVNGFGKALLVILALILLGSRQLALGILTHDASHSTLFKTRWMNDYLVDWLCSRMVWNNVHYYRPYHLRHHAKTSTPDDPDLSLVAGLPTTQASIMRKFARDIFGITGIKFVIGRLLMDFGFMEWTVANDVRWIAQDHVRWWQYPIIFLKNSGPTLIVNGLLWAVLWSMGHGWLYLLWPVAYITPFPLFLRIRSMAEHAGTETSLDVLRNTRTTRAGIIARLLFAPIHVNYHIEHHLMASVPYYRLPLMHKMLRERGYVQAPPGYWDVLKLVSSKTN